MKLISRERLRLGIFLLGMMVLVSLPFMIFGEAFAMQFLEDTGDKTAWLVALVIALLAADAVLPVPSAWVLIFLAHQAGPLAGIVGGTAGLSLGVVVAAWLGRKAIAPAAPKFFPAGELARLRDSMHRHAGVTLICMRSVPVLAETSVLLAAAAGVPLRRIFQVTLLPNLVIATIYSLAADDSLRTACAAFFVTIAGSYGYWRWHASRAASSKSKF